VKRNILFFALFILIAYAIMIRFMISNKKNIAEILPVPTTQPLPTPKIKRVDQYAYAYVTAGSLSLIPNFSDRFAAQTIYEENDCKAVINGGFYDKQNKPLGLFQVGDKTYGKQLDSDLLNGFVWMDASGTAVISSELSPQPVQFALQTGPMLLFNGNVLPLSIHNDAPARRMVAAKNSELIFLTVYNPDSVFDGPLLGDLPKIVQEISQKENLHISEAINLDGGSASAFYSEETKLSELTPVGSLFCLRGVSS